MSESQEELDRIQERIFGVVVGATKRYTWEDKIECLVEMAKAVGRYTNAEVGTDYYRDAHKELLEAYEEFCQWRHDEPYVVDEIRKMLGYGDGVGVAIG